MADPTISADRALGVWLPSIACWMATIAFGVAGLAGLKPTLGLLEWLPLAVSLLVFGLPHGAVDHLEIVRLTGRPLSSPTVLLSLLAYLLAAAGVIALWSVAPTVCFAGFIALTWLHWGQGDLWFALRHEDGNRRPLPARLSLVALRGALPMLGPLAWDPSAYRRIFEATTVLFGSVDTSAAGWQTASELGLVTLVILLFVHLLVGRHVGSSADRWIDLGETITLLALFAVVPAVFAVGLYFCAWHGPRHLVRLARLRTDRPAASWSAVGTTLRQSIPLTVVSIAGGLAIGLWLVSTSSSNTLADWFGWYLVLISGLTVPHVTVVFWMDQTEHLWFGQRAEA